MTGAGRARRPTEARTPPAVPADPLPPRSERTPPDDPPIARRRAPLPEAVEDLSPFPADAERALGEGLAALGLDLAARARSRLVDHARLLLAWTTHINLTAIREPGAVVREHLLDSLTAVPALRGLGVTTLVDLGSGGGFPGLPLAVALPEASVTLVESVAKKARFLVVATAALGLTDRVTVRHARAESLELAVDAVCARAVADLGALAALSAPLLRPGGHLVAWKRGDVRAELESAAGPLAEAGFGVAAVRAVALPGLEDHRLIIIPLERPRARIEQRGPARRARRRRW